MIVIWRLFFFSTVFYFEKRDEKRTRSAVLPRETHSKDLTKKEPAHRIWICFYFRGRGRHVTRSRRSGAFGNRRRGSLYIQINMAVRYWYGCTNISYWNFVILADCFILLLFYFSYFLHYSTPDVSARVRTFAIARYPFDAYPSSNMVHRNRMFFGNIASNWISLRTILIR